jgi:hypothetical protein
MQSEDFDMTRTRRNRYREMAEKCYLQETVVGIPEKEDAALLMTESLPRAHYLRALKHV